MLKNLWFGQFTHFNETTSQCLIKRKLVRFTTEIELSLSHALKSHFIGCKPGRYGENCTKTCNQCKNKAYCGIVDGRCDAEGCGLPGFQTPYCQGE